MKKIWLLTLGLFGVMTLLGDINTFYSDPNHSFEEYYPQNDRYRHGRYPGQRQRLSPRDPNFHGDLPRRDPLDFQYRTRNHDPGNVNPKPNDANADLSGANGKIYGHQKQPVQPNPNGERRNYWERRNYHKNFRLEKPKSLYYPP